MDVIALEASMGKSYVVGYREGRCCWEEEILHTQSGFAKLDTLIALCEPEAKIVLEATGVLLPPSRMLLPG